jgi:glycosyltransferase involved in cell wall biosynthesis
LHDVRPETPALVWNPFVATSNVSDVIFNRSRITVLDLLDDWSRHYAFAGISDSVELAYRAAFKRATHVTANSEKTVELAERFGRTDVHLLPNGCDPERFSTASSATGPTRVGYVGKIGKRVDLELVLATAAALPDVEFVFAGPILDSEYREPLSNARNITLLGDVHYSDVPKLLSTFDVGWVPHRVGGLEVGGDVIKTYEYRAAGLLVLTTPVLGSTSRGLDHVYSIAGEQHIGWLRDTVASGVDRRVGRAVSEFPHQNTWKAKVEFVAQKLGLAGQSSASVGC